MAEVWMGRRQGVGGATKSVAVKFIIPSKTNSERHREMFLSEARLSMMLSHSNVIQVFDAGEDEGRLYMVMEWVDGMNLAQLLAHMRNEGKTPSLSLGGYVIGEVLKGLSYAHNLYHEGRQITIVHRDISPQNVLVSVSGEVKLLDFGVARLAQEETSGVHIKGKLRYMAPEHLGGSSKAPTVDVYGAGAILHELIEGTKYRDGADEMQLYNQILGGHTPPLTRADTPAELAALRNTMLDPDENARVQGADLALEMLEAWPGYRSAAGELGRAVRGYMGVNSPRSGIHMKAVPKTVDAHADTAPPTAATNTRHRTGTGATSPELSASMPDAGTDPSVGPIGPAGMHSDMSQPIVIQKKGTSALLLGVGAGLLVAVGAVGVAVALRGSKEPEAASKDAAVVAARDLPAGEREAADSAEPSGQGEGPDEGEQEPAPLEVPDAQPSESDANSDGEGEPEANAEVAGAEESEAPPQAEAEPVGAAPDVAEQRPKSQPRRNRKGSKRGTSKPAPSEKKPSPPAASMKVSLRLKAPLTVAYVKIAGKQYVLEPMKRVSLPVGTHNVLWRPSKDQPYVDGGSVKLEAGGKSTIRITSSGARLE